MKPTPLDNLTADELALLRWAGELPADATTADTEPGAPADLRAAFDAVDGRLRQDAERLSLPPANVAARAVVRAMKEAVETPPEPRKKSFKLRVPTWALYPAAAAAVLVFAMVGWWYSVHDEFQQRASAYNPEGGPPVLIFPGDPDVQPANESASDDQIARQFESLILPERLNGGEVERQYAALKFLEETMQ